MGCLCCKKKKTQTTSIKTSLVTDTEDYGNKIQQIDIMAPTRKISFSDFDSLKLLGTGSFGKVLLVRHRKTNSIYAMKILKKEYIIQRKQEAHTQAERDILEKIHYPFIVSLQYAFQDPDHLFFVTEFAQGGELFYHLKREHFFENERAQFYVAEIVLALGFLHKNNLIYRDLKPENVLLDKDGHVKLTDFGLSKALLSKRNSKAYTICGTPQYIAPEIIKNKGYDKTVDWWSLGVLMYEMLSGKKPFVFPKGSLRLDYFTKKVEMCNNFTEGAKDLISKFLTVEPKNRIGYGSNGIEDIKKHPYFANIDWKKLEERKIKPPFVPQIQNDTDVMYFDKAFTTKPVAGSWIEMADNVKKEDNIFDGFTYEKNICDENPDEVNNQIDNNIV